MSVLARSAFDVAEDPAFPFVRAALDPALAAPRIERGLEAGVCPGGGLDLRSIRVVHYKPGRRCLIEYEIALREPGGTPRVGTLLGKVRARGTDHASHAIQAALSARGFGPDSVDGVSVPEPVGVVEELRMWLQRKVPGVPATAGLLAPGGSSVAARIGEALRKLHATALATQRVRTAADEVRELERRLGEVAERRPGWSVRLGRLVERCGMLASGLPAGPVGLLHRDFHPDQVLIASDRLHLLDFDLCSRGPLLLDVGNLVGHLVEVALRGVGDAHALDDRIEAFLAAYAGGGGGVDRRSVDAFATLTLARHVQLSTVLPGRARTTGALLEECERRQRQ